MLPFGIILLTALEPCESPPCNCKRNSARFSVIVQHGNHSCFTQFFQNHFAVNATHATPWHVGEVFDDLEDQVYYWNTLMANITDENLPLKKMRVRAKDVPYMTTNWKNAIRAKRRALATYQNDKSDSNWDELRKWRNEATRQRRIAIKSYWKGKSDHLKENPADFYRTFMPFLGSKAPAKSSEFNLKVGDEIVKDQDKVAETLADYFASIADGIGGENVENLTEADFTNHPSVLKTAQLSIQNDAIKLNPLQKAQVQEVMESLKVKKASGCDSIPPFALKVGAEVLAISLTNLFNSYV
ncbi:hypothetical protein ACROYT_G014409 [Oculina patagonica]